MFDDLHPGPLQILGDRIAWDTPVELEELPSLAEDGFDEVRRRLLIRTDETTVRDVLTTHFPRGQRLGSENLWIRTASGKQLSDRLFEVDAVLRGRLGALRYLRKVDATGQSVSSSSVIISPGGSYPFTYPGGAVEFRGMEAALNAYTSYVSTTAPDFTEVSQTTSGTSSGYNALPAGYPALPTGPTTIWSSIASPAYIFPAGWVLEARKVDAIKNTSGTEVCWHVQDLHTYYHQKQPSA